MKEVYGDGRRASLSSRSHWTTITVDPREIANGMKIDKNFLSPLELKAKKQGLGRETGGEDDKQESAIDACYARTPMLSEHVHKRSGLS